MWSYPFSVIQERCQLFATAKQNLNCDSDWTLAQTLFGVTTFYRREPDGSLSIKLEGKLKDVPLFDQVAVLREIDLHSCWAPFCSSSLTVAHLDKLDTVGWFVVGLPQFGLMRDGCFRAVGCDSIYEDGSVLLVAHGINDRPRNGADSRHLETSATSPTTALTSGTASTANSARASVRSSESKSSRRPSAALEAYEEENKVFEVLSNDPILKRLDIPSPPTRMGSGRMTIKTFQALIHIESPTLATTKLVTNIDPNLPLIPQGLLDFLMKRLCGVLLNKLQSAAKKVSKDPITNPHAIKMREEEDFYKGWLMEKFKGVCKHRGWEMTPFTAFELTEAQLDLAKDYVANKRHKSKHDVIKLYHSMSNDRLDSFLESPRSVSASEPALMGDVDDLVGPKVRAVSSRYSDDMSDLSKNSTSSSLWRAFPLASYLREVEERTQLKKLRKIEQMRQKAADRLKRKELDDVSQMRLEELRAARTRRSSGLKIVDPAPAATHAHPVRTAPVANADNKQRSSPAGDTHQVWAVFWTRHGWFTGFVVIDILTALLFGLLYMNTTFEDYVKSREGRFWEGRKRDAAALSYIGLTGLVHFFLCYVALMYAFSSLKVGMIAGKQVKTFYSQNVHLVVGMASGSIVCLGVLKSCLVKALQWIVWKSHGLSVAAAEGAMPSLPRLPRAIVIPVQVAYDATSTCLGWARIFLLESTIVGRGVVAVYNLLVHYTLSWFRLWSGFVTTSVDQYTGTTESMTWRADAFVTTRGLLAYSATFCLVLLLAFNLVARYSRSTEFGSAKGKAGDAASSNPASKVGQRNEKWTPSSIETVASGSDNSSKRNFHARTQSLPATFESIDEDEELREVGTQGSNPFSGISKKKNGPGQGARFRLGSKSLTVGSKST